MGTLTQSNATVNTFHFTYLEQLEDGTHVFRVVPEYGAVQCPQCQQPAAPHDTDEVTVRHPSLEGPLLLLVQKRRWRCDEAQCAVTTFTPVIPGLRSRARYTEAARRLTVNKIAVDGLTHSTCRAQTARELHFQPSSATLTTWVQDEIDEEPDALSLDLSAIEVLCLDEAYPKRKSTTDDFTIVSVSPSAAGDELLHVTTSAQNDAPSLDTHCAALQRAGAQPQMVVTDLKEDYEAIIAQRFSGAGHQYCIYHVVQNINRHFNATMKDFRQTLPKGTRQRLFRARYRFLKGQENLSGQEAWELGEWLDEYAETVLVRAYHLKEDIRAIFQSRSLAEAYARRDMILERQPEFAATPMSKALRLLETKFDKMVTYLRLELPHPTNNPAERTIRSYRRMARQSYGFRNPASKKRYLKMWYRRQRQKLKRAS
ncbi:MAG: transposase [Chloroflexi bacterium]|nr:transposase [Chloroflexota bacterium]MBU1750498.1 transposase [Chloroflexota bacterium]